MDTHKRFWERTSEPGIFTLLVRCIKKFDVDHGAPYCKIVHYVRKHIPLLKYMPKEIASDEVRKAIVFGFKKGILFAENGKFKIRSKYRTCICEEPWINEVVCFRCGNLFNDATLDTVDLRSLYSSIKRDLCCRAITYPGKVTKISQRKAKRAKNIRFTRNKKTKRIPLSKKRRSRRKHGEKPTANSPTPESFPPPNGKRLRLTATDPSSEFIPNMILGRINSKEDIFDQILGN